ncbi:hypothetical protein N7481_010273 [Penicillium waksmanii]|uniref:uncharacterized protein n=1 Tax=Penicillium waksmanii TaxID=69791 RepID=UPI002549C05D|nr:uncharacterized protein N7481_010273 [Penicillium waksmanii]KAJ5976566.1 hypothetical protein N7481_010273 [Penicillium waksmanii]
MSIPEERRVGDDATKEDSFKQLIDEYSALELGEREATDGSLTSEKADSEGAQASINYASDQQEQDAEEIHDLGTEQEAEEWMNTYRTPTEQAKLSFSENRRLGDLHSKLSNYYLSHPSRFDAQFNTINGQLQSQNDEEEAVNTQASNSHNDGHPEQGSGGDPQRQGSSEAAKNPQTPPFPPDDLRHTRSLESSQMSNPEIDKDFPEDNSAELSSMGMELGVANSPRQGSYCLQSRSDNATDNDGSLGYLCPVSGGPCELSSIREPINNDLVDGWGNFRRSTFVIIRCGPHHAAKYRFEYWPNYKNHSMAKISDRAKRISSLEDTDRSGETGWRYVHENIKDVHGVVSEARNPCKDYIQNWKTLALHASARKRKRNKCREEVDKSLLMNSMFLDNQ